MRGGSLGSVARAMKSSWATLAQVAAWLCGIVSVFILSPPDLWAGAPGDGVTWFARFLVALVAALLFAATRRWSGLQHIRRWVAAVAVAALVGGASLLSYNVLYAGWTCWWIDKSWTVTGDPYLPAAQQQIEQQHLTHASCSEIIEASRGYTYQLWDEGQILRRYIILVTLFIASTTLLSAAVISVLQTLRCAGFSN